MKQQQGGNGGFNGFNLFPQLLKAIQFKGFSTPTPIQRKSMPPILEGRDVVAMARTGSGKTAAFLIPLVNKLKVHSAKVGARGLILSPSRELALQTLKVAQELCNYTDLRCCGLVGGDSMEEQFAAIAGNPDMYFIAYVRIVATPGRLMHLMIEMNLDLKTVELVVFDEADRLFEMGFAEQLHEVLHKLPASRQTLLFSATLPKLLVDFTKAGLSDPVLIRLDVDSKLSKDLALHFYGVKAEEKDAALLYTLRHLVEPKALTIVFVATKHHVEYIQTLLNGAGIPATYIYGALDQEARRIHLSQFRSGKIPVMVVTDVAARGIDVPLLDYVINYDFPGIPKVFVHRVGRVARAGRKGTAISLVAGEELAYLMDFQLFIGRPFFTGMQASALPSIDYTRDIVLGNAPPTLFDLEIEQVTQLVKADTTLNTFLGSAKSAYKLYIKTKPSASNESFNRSKELVKCGVGYHPLLSAKLDKTALEQTKLLDEIANFRPAETIFEVGKRGTKSQEASLMRKRRNQFTDQISDYQAQLREKRIKIEEKIREEASRPVEKDFVDEEYYMSHFQKDANTERGYSMQTKPANFVEQMKMASVDLHGDEAESMLKKRSSLLWDKKKHKFVRPTVGSDNKKRIRTESGLSISASYKTDRFKKWQDQTRVKIPRAGEKELADSGKYAQARTKKYIHTKQMAPDVNSASFQRKKKAGKYDSSEAQERLQKAQTKKAEIKTKTQIAKERILKAKRREKTGRHAKKGKRNARMSSFDFERLFDEITNTQRILGEDLDVGKAGDDVTEEEEDGENPLEMYAQLYAQGFNDQNEVDGVDEVEEKEPAKVYPPSLDATERPVLAGSRPLRAVKFAQGSTPDDFSPPFRSNPDAENEVDSDDDVPLAARVSYRFQNIPGNKPRTDSFKNRGLDQQSVTPNRVDVVDRMRRIQRKTRQQTVRNIKVRIYIGNDVDYVNFELTSIMTADIVLELLIRQHNVAQYPDWVLFELCNNLGLERPIRDWELVMDVLDAWDMAAMANSLRLVRPENKTSSSPISIVGKFPKMQGSLYLELRPGKWSHKFCFLKDNCLMYFRDHESNTEHVYCSLDEYDVYSMVPHARKPKKLPTQFCFALRSVDHPSIDKSKDHVKYVCVERPERVNDWMIALRLSKNEMAFVDFPFLFDGYPEIPEKAWKRRKRTERKFADFIPEERPVSVQTPGTRPLVERRESSIKKEPEDAPRSRFKPLVDVSSITTCKICGCDDYQINYVSKDARCINWYFCRI